MARRAEQDLNEHSAQKIANKALNLIQRALIFIGRPFYFILSHIVIALFFLLYAVGFLTRKLVFIFGYLLLQLIKLPFKLELPKVKVPQISKPKLKVKVPRTFLAKILTAIKLIVLSFMLKLAGVHLPSLKITLPKLRLRLKVGFAFWAFIILLFTPIFFLFYIFHNLPSPKTLVTRNLEVSTKIYDRNGVLLYNIFQDKNRTLVKLEEVPLVVRLATLASEDAEFYQHPGFSVKGVLRALYKIITKGELTGGSTITQQLVKNALLTPEKTVIRKIREVILAVITEMQFSKDEILEMYLNEVSYGGTSYGIAEASETYFAKDVKELTLAESAMLAGLPKSPTAYSPFGSDPNKAFVRQREVLSLMRINGFITKEQEEEAANQQITFASNKTDIKAPHFVMFVRSLLEEKYGKEIVAKGGLEVTTTLDYEIQKLAEKAVRDELSRLGSLHVQNGAVVVLTPTTGEILAMVGSKDYFDTAHDGNVNVVTSLRQPGSSIKVVNYAYALSNGYTPLSIISDSPITYLVKGQEPYTPKNYDGTFRGNLTLRSAFAESRNVPAVKVLASYGVNKMIEMGKKMGITTWEETNRFGLSLTLGGGEVRLIELAQVYATVANLGRKPNLSSIVKITDYKGRLFEENSCVQKTAGKEPIDIAQAKGDFGEISQDCKGEEVLDPRVSYLITDILKDNIARSPAFGSSSALVIPNHPEVAVKTGTSNNLRDNLTIGYNQKYLVAVWVGNNDNSPMARVASGVTGASPIWNKIMTSLLSQEKSVDWQVPEGLVSLPVCSLTGTLACDGCSNRLEWFLKENTPKTACNSDYVNKLREEKEKQGEKKIGEIFEPAAATSVTN